MLDETARTAVSLFVPNLVIWLFWILFSLSLWMLSAKLRWKRRWYAWVPGMRYAAFGASVRLERQGAVCGVLEVLFLVLGALDVSGISDRLVMALGLAMLILQITLFVYQIRLFLRLTVLFGARRRWVILWLLAKWIPVMIFALSKRFQPQLDLTALDDWTAGTRPADLPGVSPAPSAENADSGLNVVLRDRTVKDFFNKRYLLKDISLFIPNGSLVMLLGGSGSGKTTFVNALIGYEKANASITLNGRDVYRDHNQVKYRIGFVPQQNLIRGGDTVRHTVSDAAEMRMDASLSARDREKRVGEVMELLGLSSGSNGLVSKKSGGRQRRISIAMELVADPELFVLDEPDSGLDGVIARELFTKLRSIADEGKIVIVITHTPDRVSDLFDKVIVLARDSGRVGRLAFYGSPDQARSFFGKDTMEGVVMCINSREEGGEGRADEFIQRFAQAAVGSGAEAKEAVV